MKLKIIGSSSSGNNYILETKDSALVIEAGLSFAKLKEAINFDVAKIKGVLCSHSHQDHSKFIHNYLQNGINCYSSKECIEEMKFTNHANFLAVKESTKYQIGDFTIIPIPMVHDVVCFGYLIHHAECGLVLFATDTMFIKHKVEGLNQIIVEANYCEDIIENRFKTGKLGRYLKERIENSHLSFQNCKKFLEANNTTKVNNIVLIHLSDGNSCESTFVKEVIEMTGKKVFAANKEMEIDFNLNPF